MDEALSIRETDLRNAKLMELIQEFKKPDTFQYGYFMQASTLAKTILAFRSNDLNFGEPVSFKIVIDLTF